MAHIVRALHEANAYRLARLAELIVASSPSANRMILGGGSGIEDETEAIDAIRAAVAPLPLSRADDEHLSMRGAAMFALVAAGNPADRTHADRRLRQLSEMVAARATPVAAEAHLRETYGALYRRWLAWMETVLPPMETPGGSTLEDGDGGSRG
jgi:ribulose kinase